jgi:hypothetical protein
MDLENTNLVRTQDERPNRRDGTCFYCRTPIGQPHKEGCVVLSKTVVVRVSLEVVISVPRDWNPSLIDFHLNDSSWCADNLFSDLADWLDEENKERGPACTCGTFKGELLRDATADDHEHLPVLISDDK